MYGHEIAPVNQAAAVGGALGTARSLTLSDRLKMQREQLKERLQLIDEALAALESSPQIAQAVNAISRLGGII